jgi:hypothetical protein
MGINWVGMQLSIEKAAAIVMNILLSSETKLNIALKERCRILPAGGLGVSPSFKKSPKLGGYRGLIETISTVS